MDEDKITEILLWFVLLIICLLISLAVFDAVKESYARLDCLEAGFEDGDYLVWRKQTVCSNLVTPYKNEVREYHVLEDF